MFEPEAAVPFHTARDPVNMPTIRRWCDAIGDRNPVHTDPELARRSRFGEVVAPLAMLDVWTKPGLAYERSPDDPQGAAFARLDGAGYTAAVAVTTDLVQRRHLTLGETVSSTIALESVSDEKSTALGAGHFVTTLQAFYSSEELVGEARFTVLKYRPATAATPSGAGRTDSPDGVTSPGRRAASSACSDPPRRDDLGTVVAEGLDPGQPIPPTSIPITATLIVAGALMTSDYFDAHHDRDAAQRRGTPDIFMNIHTTGGLLTAHVGNWLGPNVAWRSMRIRLGAPNHPGDVMDISASLSSIDAHTGATQIAVTAGNGLGVHARAEVEVELPIR